MEYASSPYPGHQQETGLGSTAGQGEGLLGFQRAFQVAGAKTVMAGLWSVPDRETMLLMQRFYQSVWTKKLPKGEALREAQIWMLKEGHPRGLDLEESGAKKPTSGRLTPKLWAGFVLSGDWR
jgi:CHAT domain-containing protein